TPRTGTGRPSCRSRAAPGGAGSPSAEHRTAPAAARSASGTPRRRRRSRTCRYVREEWARCNRSRAARLRRVAASWHFPPGLQHQGDAMDDPTRCEPLGAKRGGDEPMDVVVRLDTEPPAARDGAGGRVRQRNTAYREHAARSRPEDSRFLRWEVLEAPNIRPSREAGGQLPPHADGEGDGTHSTQAGRRAGGVVALERAGCEVERGLRRPALLEWCRDGERDGGRQGRAHVEGRHDRVVHEGRRIGEADGGLEGDLRG